MQFLDWVQKNKLKVNEINLVEHIVPCLKVCLYLCPCDSFLKRKVGIRNVVAN